jgi:transposase
LTSKIHLAADRRCRPISRVTSAGQRHDSLGLRPVLAGIRICRRGPGRPRTRPGRVLGDKAYSSRAIRAYLRKRRIKATIPEPADQKNNRLRRGRTGGRPPAFDPETYKQRNVVERAVILCGSAEVQATDLTETINPEPEIRIGGKMTLAEIENAHMQKVIANTATLDEAAVILGIDPATLYRKRKKL